MNWRSVDHVVRELQLEANPADGDELKRELRLKLAAIHPDRSGGAFANKDDEAQYNIVSSAYEFIKTATDESCALIPVTQLSAIIKAIRAAALLLPATWLLQTGCAGTPAGIVIHDYATGRTAAEIPMGSLREIIRTEARPAEAFFTMTEENNQLVIRKRDANGVELSKRPLPIVNSVWHEPNWCALDDSGGRLAYFDDEAKRLKLRNLKSNSTTDLPTPKINSPVSIRLFAWTGPNSLLLLSTLPDDSSSMEISNINTRNLAIQTKSVDLNWFPYPTLSPDGERIAGVTGNGQLVVLDSSTFQRKSVIAAFDSEIKIKCAKWSADSVWLYFVTTRTKDDKSQLFRQSVAKNSREELPLPTKSSFYLQDSLGETIAASIVGTAKVNCIFDVKRRSWKTIGRSNGDIYGISGTTRYAVTQ